MTMLKPARQKAAYAKIGLYGEAGSGKTFTAALFAIGLHQHLGLDKPVGMFDTEPAAGFIKHLFDEAGIEFLVYDESRALSDLMKFMDEAEETCSITLVDSITHVWRDAQESYLKKVNERLRQQNRRPIYQLEFHHWRPIKAAWGTFTDRFMSSHMHVLVCGRAGTIYSYQDKDDGSGKRELIQEGTRMATEKEMGYEPSLLIEMLKKLEDHRILNTAIVEKDRSDRLNGHEISMPTFQHILPHIEALDLGGEHHGSMEARDSQDMFSGDEVGSTFDQEKRRRTVLCEEIIGEFVRFGCDGTSKDAKATRLDILERVFGTRSWESVTNKQSDLLAAGLESVREVLAEVFAPPASLEDQLEASLDRDTTDRG